MTRTSALTATFLFELVLAATRATATVEVESTAEFILVIHNDDDVIECALRERAQSLSTEDKEPSLEQRIAIGSIGVRRGVGYRV